MGLSGIFLSSCSIKGIPISLNIFKDKTAYKGLDAVERHLRAMYGNTACVTYVVCYKYEHDGYSYWYSAEYQEYSTGYLKLGVNKFAYSISRDAADRVIDESIYGLARANGKSVKIKL